MSEQEKPGVALLKIVLGGESEILPVMSIEVGILGPADGERYTVVSIVPMPLEEFDPVFQLRLDAGGRRALAAMLSDDATMILERENAARAARAAAAGDKH